MEDTARLVAQEDATRLVTLLREVLIDLARSPEPDHERLLRAPDGAGKRQFVLGGDVIALAAMALLGYFLHRTGGKKSEAKKRRRTSL